jgi:hypothetical protein
MIVNLTLVVNIKHHHRNLEEKTVVFTDIKSLFFSGWVVYYGCQEQKGGRHRFLTYLGFSSKHWMWSLVDVVIVNNVWVCVCSSVCSVYHHRKFLYPWSDFTWNRLRCAKIFFPRTILTWAFGLRVVCSRGFSFAWWGWDEAYSSSWAHPYITWSCRG